MSLILFVGDCTEYLAKIACTSFETAQLIDFDNFEDILDRDDDIVGYTSVADLPTVTDEKSAFLQLLARADRIYYCPPPVWSDERDFEPGSFKKTTEYFLYQEHCKNKNVIGMHEIDSSNLDQSIDEILAEIEKFA